MSEFPFMNMILTQTEKVDFLESRIYGLAVFCHLTAALYKCALDLRDRAWPSCFTKVTDRVQQTPGAFSQKKIRNYQCG